MSGTPRSTRSRLENIDWSHQHLETASSSGGEHTEGVDLVLKLQQKLKEAEKYTNKLQKKLEEQEKEDRLSDEHARTHDVFKLQQLEVENSRLRSNLANLQIAAADGSGSQELVKQYNALCVELDRQRDESIQLHSILAKQTQGLKNVASNNYGSHIDVINEDGVLVMAFEEQKKINRQLEDELQKEKNKWDSERAELLPELEKLKEENENLRKILLANVTESPQSQAGAFMQHEIQRLTSENLDLKRKLSAMIEQVTDEVEAVNENSLVPIDKVVSSNKDQRNNICVGRKKECEFQGMFEYRTEDVDLIVRHLIYDLKPRTAVTLLPGLPAYILFMCIRHTDCINDNEKGRALLTATINMIKKVTEERHNDLNTTVLWLSNTLRLLHNLKQYSGDKMFQAENTPKQNKQCLRNFDLSEYRQDLSDVAEEIYQAVIGSLEEIVSNMIVPAILEHEAISALSTIKLCGMRGRLRRSESTKVPVGAKDALIALQELSNVHKILGYHGVDPDVFIQIFRQIFYFICADSLNNILLRQDLCHWTKGVQIRYNLSLLEQWCREHHLQDTSVLDALQPLIQATQLLKARNKDEDVQSICDNYEKLSMCQKRKILINYRPIHEFEFIRRIEQELQERNKGQDQQFLMDMDFSFSVGFPFNPSNIRLEDIEIPEVLNLPMLKKA